MSLYTVNQKKTPKCFLSYLQQNLTDSDKIWYVLSRVNLSYMNVIVFRLTWIMSLRYLCFCNWTAVGTVNRKKHHNVCTTVTDAQNHSFGKIQDRGWRHLGFGFLSLSWSPVKLFSPYLVCTQIWPYNDVAKITLFIKFRMVAIWTKFSMPIQNEMPMMIDGWIFYVLCILIKFFSLMSINVFLPRDAMLVLQRGLNLGSHK